MITALAVGGDGSLGELGMVGDAGKISCASCHVGPGLDDRRSKPGTVSLGADWLGRNSLPLVNAAYYRWVNWAGRFSAQWELPIAVLYFASSTLLTVLVIPAIYVLMRGEREEPAEQPRRWWRIWQPATT